ncbi:MAG: preprotein translocase subunit SecA [Oscillospiraceae bacterium]
MAAAGDAAVRSVKIQFHLSGSFPTILLPTGIVAYGAQESKGFSPPPARFTNRSLFSPFQTERLVLYCICIFARILHFLHHRERMFCYMGLLNKVFGSYSDRELKRVTPIVDKIEALEEEFHALSDAQLTAKTGEFKQRLAAGETLDDLLPEAFATCREACVRVLGLRPYRVQLIGGVVLHQGRIAEMKTGEGKTLVATLPAYLNALSGQGVHIVTVNDYLAKRDSEWMGKVYRFLGLKVGLIVHGLERKERQEAYNADITYGTNNEMGFDYLRDNMAIYAEELVQRGHHFAIVDEVDSILIDEARTPLIISGTGEKSTQLYDMAEMFAARLKKQVVTEVDSKEEEDTEIDADYIVDEKNRTASLTARGVKKAEEFFHLENLSDPENSTISHHINQAIKAHGVMKRDVDYVLKDGEVVIVDEFTGRLMFGRRYNEGLHQAIEAKEHVTVARESKTLASITFQNYFRLYDKLSGMTGTAMTEEEEFGSIYKLDILEIPTNKPVIRIDNPDVVYKTERAKYRAVIEQVKACHAKGQPVLVGTVSIEKNELLSKLLQKEGIKHNLLNAKNHEKEAEIVAQAGKLGAVTVATNMAGRGTDIMLGGNAEYLAKNDLRKAGCSDELIAEATGYAETSDPEILDARKRFAEALAKRKAEIAGEAEKVREAGGLFIIGTERHESRRIDNQLRGRSGRQGDPGETRFYISLEDDLMRLFGGERVQNMMDRLNVDENLPIENKMLSRSIENSQTSIESRNFQSRKSVLEYDDVMNRQREIIYGQRRQVLEGRDIHDLILGMIESGIAAVVQSAFAGGSLTPESYKEMMSSLEGVYFPKYTFRYDESVLRKSAEELTAEFTKAANACYAKKDEEFTVPIMRELERIFMLRTVDEYWMDHIDAMAELRQGIRLRAYGNENPVDAYKRESFAMFEDMVQSIQNDTVRRLFSVHRKENQEIKRERVAVATSEGFSDGTVKKQPRRVNKIGRNDPCPCGSGKKYKNCCGR